MYIFLKIKINLLKIVYPQKLGMFAHSTNISGVEFTETAKIDKFLNKKYEK